MPRAAGKERRKEKAKNGISKLREKEKEREGKSSIAIGSITQRVANRQAGLPVQTQRKFQMKRRLSLWDFSGSERDIVLKHQPERDSPMLTFLLTMFEQGLEESA